MAERVSVTITIGGVLPASRRDALAAIIADEGLSREWDGPPFDASEFPKGEPLTLYAHEVAWGRVETLEAFCVEQGLAFARWSGGYPGQWDPERVVFTGDGAPRSFAASEDDYAMIGRHTAEALGSYAAILANFDAADFHGPAASLPRLKNRPRPGPDGDSGRGIAARPGRSNRVSKRRHRAIRPSQPPARQPPARPVFAFA